MDRIRFIRRARDLGFTLTEVEELREENVDSSHGENP